MSSRHGELVIDLVSPEPEEKLKPSATCRKEKKGRKDKELKQRLQFATAAEDDDIDDDETTSTSSARTTTTNNKTISNQRSKVANGKGVAGMGRILTSFEGSRANPTTKRDQVNEVISLLETPDHKPQQLSDPSTKGKGMIESAIDRLCTVNEEDIESTAGSPNTSVDEQRIDGRTGDNDEDMDDVAEDSDMGNDDRRVALDEGNSNESASNGYSNHDIPGIITSKVLFSPSAMRSSILPVASNNEYGKSQSQSITRPHQAKKTMETSFFAFNGDGSSFEQDVDETILNDDIEHDDDGKKDDVLVIESNENSSFEVLCASQSTTIKRQFILDTAMAIAPAGMNEKATGGAKKRSRSERDVDQEREDHHDNQDDNHNDISMNISNSHLDITMDYEYSPSPVHQRRRLSISSIKKPRESLSLSVSSSCTRNPHSSSFYVSPAPHNAVDNSIIIGTTACKSSQPQQEDQSELYYNYQYDEHDRILSPLASPLEYPESYHEDVLPASNEVVIDNNPNEAIEPVASTPTSATTSRYYYIQDSEDDDDEGTKDNMFGDHVNEDQQPNVQPKTVPMQQNIERKKETMIDLSQTSSVESDTEQPKGGTTAGGSGSMTLMERLRAKRQQLEITKAQFQDSQSSQDNNTVVLTRAATLPTALTEGIANGSTSALASTMTKGSNDKDNKVPKLSNNTISRTQSLPKGGSAASSSSSAIGTTSRTIQSSLFSFVTAGSSSSSLSAGIATTGIAVGTSRATTISAEGLNVYDLDGSNTHQSTRGEGGVDYPDTSNAAHSYSYECHRDDTYTNQSNNGWSRHSAISVLSSTSVASDASASRTNNNTQHTQTKQQQDANVPPMVPLDPSVEYDVTVLVDKRERSNALIVGNLISNRIPCELASLAVGDFLWVAVPRKTNNPSNGEDTTGTATTTTTGNGKKSKKTNATTTGGDSDSILTGLEHEILVLDCIAERKSIPDLASSLVDGRYTDQKCRLKTTGIKSCLYLVEGEHLVVPMQQKAITPQHLKTAMAVTHIEHDMHVIRTRGMDHSTQTLQYIHRQVAKRFQKAYEVSKQQQRQSSTAANGEEEPLLFQRFSDFQSLYGKKTANTYKQLFGHQLRQVHGCSTSAANALMERFGTTANFMKYLSTNERHYAQKSIENMYKKGDAKGRIGPKLAKTLYEVYYTEY